MSYVKMMIDLIKVKYEQTGLSGVNGFLKSNKVKHIVEVKEFTAQGNNIQEKIVYARRMNPYGLRNIWIDECPEDEFRCYYYDISRKGFTVYRAKSIKILQSGE